MSTKKAKMPPADPAQLAIEAEDRAAFDRALAVIFQPKPLPGKRVARDRVKRPPRGSTTAK